MTAIAFMQLALIGLAVAAIFFAVAWLKSKTFTFHRLVLLTTFFTFDLILFGAFTRLTDSGLGCPDWPGCYGLSNPWAAIKGTSLSKSVKEKYRRRMLAQLTGGMGINKKAIGELGGMAAYGNPED